VYNSLVDTAAVERLVLASSPQEAMECAFRSGLGSNIKEVYTADGTKYFKRGSAETTLPNKQQPVPRLGMDVAQAMQSLSERATQAAGAVKAAKATVSAAKARVDTIKKEQARIQGERSQMRKKLARAEGLVEELNDELAHPRSAASHLFPRLAHNCRFNAAAVCGRFRPVSWLALKGEPLARETASKTDETILSWPHTLLQTPWCSPTSLTALCQLGNNCALRRR
jgi:hypothetical protein